MSGFLLFFSSPLRHILLAYGSSSVPPPSSRPRTHSQPSQNEHCQISLGPLIPPFATNTVVVAYYTATFKTQYVFQIHRQKRQKLAVKQSNYRSGCTENLKTPVLSEVKTEVNSQTILRNPIFTLQTLGRKPRVHFAAGTLHYSQL